MSFLKRFGACVLCAATLLCVLCSCNQSKTKTIMTVDGEDVPSGIYIFYLKQATSELDEKIEEASFEGDRWAFTDTEVKNAKQWVKDTALQYTKELIAVEKKFAELGLSFTDEQISNIEYICEYYWASIGESYEDMGISYTSFLRCYKVGSMGGEIVDYYYGEGGEKEIPDEEYKAYMTENYSRVNHILISNEDDDGNALTDDALTEAENKAKALLAEAQTADEETFRTLIKENSADYSESTDLALGYVKPLEDSGYVTEFEDAVKALKPGETSTELCKSQYGWHIIRRYEMFGDDEVDIDDYRDSLITEMTEDEYDAMKAEWVKAITFNLVKASYNRYDPSDKKIVGSDE